MSYVALVFFATLAAIQATVPSASPAAHIVGRVSDDTTAEPLPTPAVGMPSITVAPGEHVTGLALTMSRGAELAGRVFDEAGKPLRDVGVGALRLDRLLSLKQMVPSLVVARTNAAGEFRVPSLQPGRYVVVASRFNSGSATGRPVRDSLTYFPGTNDLHRAQLVDVKPRGTVEGLDFELVRTPSFEVAGFVVDEAGRPVGGVVVALDADWPLFGGPKGSDRTQADGRFRIPTVAAGDYMLTVTNPGSEPKPVRRQMPFVRITIVDTDVTGLVIQISAQ